MQENGALFIEVILSEWLAIKNFFFLRFPTFDRMIPIVLHSLFCGTIETEYDL